MNSLLLDTDVVIDAHRLNIWDNLLSKNKVHIGLIALRVEVGYYINNEGKRKNINLLPQLRVGKIAKLSATLAEQRAFRQRFDRVLGPILGLGEIESLVIIQKRPELAFCTFDQAAIAALVLLGMEKRGISFETVLKQCGLSRKLEQKHSEERFRRIVKRAHLMRVMEQGLRLTRSHPLSFRLPHLPVF